MEVGSLRLTSVIWRLSDGCWPVTGSRCWSTGGFSSRICFFFILEDTLLLGLNNPRRAALWGLAPPPPLYYTVTNQPFWTPHPTSGASEIFLRESQIVQRSTKHMEFRPLSLSTVDESSPTIGLQRRESPVSPHRCSLIICRN